MAQMYICASEGLQTCAEYPIQQVMETNMHNLTFVLILLSWSAHVDSWCGGMGTFSNGIIHSDAPPVQLHAIGSLHCLGNAKMSSD